MSFGRCFSKRIQRGLRRRARDSRLQARRGGDEKINDWVARQTHDRIRDLIPQPLDAATRLVLANALCLKAPRASEFSAGATAPKRFHVRGGEAVDVPTMRKEKISLRETQGILDRGVTLQRRQPERFVILVPDKIGGLGELERKADGRPPGRLRKNGEESDVVLYLPKFKFEPPTIRLAAELQALGMKTAFDIRRERQLRPPRAPPA